MPSIAEAIALNNARIAAQKNPAPSAGISVQEPLTIAPTPPQDAPAGLGLPQRGMFPANVVLASDRSDSSRAFRGAGMRSATFPFAQNPQVVTTNITQPTTTIIQQSSTASSSSSSSSSTVVTGLPSGGANQIIATPDGMAGASGLRLMVAADEPSTTVNIVANDTNVTGSISNQTLTLGWTGTLSIARGGTGTSSPGLIGGTNVTVTGSWPNQTISASGGGGGGGVGGVSSKSADYLAVSGDAGSLLAFNTVGVTFVQGGQNAASGVTTLSRAFVSNNTAGNLIVVAIACWKSGGFSGTVTVSDTQTNTYTQIGSALTEATSKTFLYYASNIKSGANTVTVVPSVSADLDFAIHEYTEVTSSPFDASSSGGVTGGSVANTGTMTTGSNGDLLFGFSYDQHQSNDVFSATGSPVSIYTKREQTINPNNECLASFDSISGIAGSYSIQFSIVPNTTTGMHAWVAGFKSSGNLTLTLPASPPSSTWMIFASNYGTGTLIVNPNGLDINGGSSSIAVLPGIMGVQIFTDGTNYFTN